jgi:hypothetical protein
MAGVQKPSNLVCYTQLSEPSGIYSKYEISMAATVQIVSYGLLHSAVSYTDSDVSEECAAPTF